MNSLRELWTKQESPETDLFRMQIKHYGVLNKDKTIYHITEANKNLGFFAMYRYWLEYLYFADVCGYTPVINPGPEFAYREKEKVNGTKNPFEYYFVQPSQISVQSAKLSRNVVDAEVFHRQMVELVFTGRYCHYKANKRYMLELARIVGKYIRFNHPAWEYISNGMDTLQMQGEKVLGVHIRGTDFRSNYNNHPIYINEDECFKEIDLLLHKNSYTKIFVATDDGRILKNFTGRYGDRLCYYSDVMRSYKNQSVAFSKSSREKHKYLLGLEVIRDMYTLSVCSGLVAGISQVAICARINKLSRQEQYENIKIIDKGLNQNHHGFRRY